MLPYLRKTSNNLYTVAFYNLENLFDTKNNPQTLDDDFTPYGKNKWNKERYENKLYKLSKTVSEIGSDTTKKVPSIVGFAEVENKSVVEDLITSKYLKEHDYDFVHYDSPDERGIDTALIYRKEDFEVLASEAHPLIVYNDNGERDYTRDILHVTGRLNNEQIHVLVNHWPSRREGAEATSYKRVEAAQKIHEIIYSVKQAEEDPSFIIMGDFNDNPGSESIKDHLMYPDLYNPMAKLLDPYSKGSLNHQARWNLFDQIIFTNNFFNDQAGTHSFAHADVFDELFLKEWHGKFKGNPFRTFAGSKYLGGYSDHFPVYVLLKQNY